MLTWQRHVRDCRGRPFPDKDATLPWLPRFCQRLREDSQFPPRCRHATRSPFCQGFANWGNCDMGIEGGRLVSISIAGLMMYLAGTPYAALGHGEADAQMAEPAAFGSALSGPQLDKAAAIVVAEARAINQVVPA